MTEIATSPQVIDHRVHWKWFLALGVVLLLLGVAGVSISTVLDLTTLFVFGPLLLASSAIQLLTSLFAEKRKEALLHFAAAAVEALFGFVIMLHPPERIAGLLAVIAIFLLVGGLV